MMRYASEREWSNEQSVEFTLVGQPRKVCFGAGGAIVESSGGQRGRRIGGERRQAAKLQSADVKAPMQADCGVLR
eukprot:6203278-Pleurochrysis_carterae.AAC.1